MAINELIRWAAAKQAIYWFLSPFYSQTTRNVWDDPQMLPRYIPPGWGVNNSSHTLKAPNGSIIYFLGADNPESLKGPNPFGVVFDEFDDIKIQVWEEVVRPILAMNQGWAWFVGTPKGQGNLFKFFNRQDNEWASFMLKASQSGLFPDGELEKAKREMPEATYKQEMECEFIAGGSNVFKQIKENVYYNNLEPWKIFPQRKYKMGVDLAKLNDWTVLTPIDLHTWHVGEPERFNQVDYNLIEARIEAAYRRLNESQISLDSTGVGEPVADHLEQKGIPVERFVFTEQSKMQLLQNLAIMLEQNKIKLPNYEPLLNELSAMRYELGGVNENKLKMISPIADDCVMSLALVVKDLIAPYPLPQDDWRMEKTIRNHSKINPFY